MRERQTPHLILVKIESGKVVRDFGEQSAPPQRLVFSPNGKQLTAVFPDKLERWEVSTGKRLPPVNVGENAAIQFAPDGKTLAVADGKEASLLDARHALKALSYSVPASNVRDNLHGEGRRHRLFTR